MGEDRAEILSGKMDWGSISLESVDKKETSEISGHRERTSQPRSLIWHELSFPLESIQTQSTPVTEASCLSTEDALNFWKGIADVGLLGEVVTNISTELQELLSGVQQRKEAAALQDTGTEQG